MDHEWAFLQAIREEPDDDAHRLIYADWLEEYGGADRAARATFIRAQCRLDALPDDDPSRDDLEDQAAEVLTEHEREWTQPLHGVAEDWRFSRGFIEHITIRGDSFLTHSERLFDFAPLRAVHLLINLKDVPQLAACPRLHWVEALDFRRCHLNDRSLRQLLTSPHLERLSALNLDGNNINTPGVRALIQSLLFARLEYLDLSRNLAVGDAAARLLAHQTPANNLEVLRLSGTNLTLDSFYDLLQSTRLSQLRHLHVSGARATFSSQSGSLQPCPSGDFGNFKLLAQLRSLDLSETCLPVRLLYHLERLSSVNLPINLCALYLRDIAAESGDAELLAQLASLANLTFLDLSRNNLGAEGAQVLADSPHLASLKRLDVSANNIRDTGAKAIAESPHLRHLWVLDLTGNGIGGPGLKALAASVNLDRLRILNLAGNFIGADSVRALAESTHLSQLRQIDLSDACLEEDSARFLASSANLTHLHTLLLQKNQLGDGGAKALAQSPHLQRLTELNLNDNRIGKAGAEALAASSWRRLHTLNVRRNVFTDTQEVMLRGRFGDAVIL